MEYPAVISVKDLSAGYRKNGRIKTVLTNISFNISEGKMICLAGANGIGKSTLLKTIAGLLPALGGEILIREKPLGQYRKEEIARLLSIVLTSKIPTGNLKAGELVSLGRYPYTNWLGTGNSSDEEKINEAMALTGTTEYRSQPIHELSDGQLQKVLIARALAQDSGIILLDEPTAHLDLMNKIVIMTLLKDLASKTGKSILIATHELELAMQVSDGLLLLPDTANIISGTPEDLVLNGVIGKYINQKGVNFNEDTGRFVPVRAGGKKINLESHDPVTGNWTRNALERCGFTVTRENCPYSVSADKVGNRINWEIKHPNGGEIVHSIEELLIFLNKTL